LHKCAKRNPLEFSLLFLRVKFIDGTGAGDTEKRFALLYEILRNPSKSGSTGQFIALMAN
jgi:hypothetical protein